MKDYYSFIDEYLEGKLEDSHKIAMEVAIEKDEKLRNAVQNHPLVKKIASNFAEIEAEEILEKIKNKKPKKKFLGNLIRIAAIGLIILVSIWFMLENGQVKYSELAMNAYVNPVSGNTRSANSEQLQGLALAEHLLNLDRYDECIEILNELPSSEEEDRIPLYLAHSNFMLGNYDRVESYLDEIDSQTLINKSMYLLALNYIAQEKLDLGISVLKNIVKGENPYSQYANELLETLE